MNDPDAPSVRIPHRALGTILAVVVVLGVLPVMSALIALNAAPLLGCRIDPRVSLPCLLGPVDLGAALHNMAIVGWFGFTTAPPAMVLFVVWIAVVLAFIARRTLARKGYGRV